MGRATIRLGLMPHGGPGGVDTVQDDLRRAAPVDPPEGLACAHRSAVQLARAQGLTNLSGPIDPLNNHAHNHAHNQAHAQAHNRAHDCVGAQDGLQRLRPLPLPENAQAPPGGRETPLGDALREDASSGGLGAATCSSPRQQCCS
jgi:hypothetical protein